MTVKPYRYSVLRKLANGPAGVGTSQEIPDAAVDSVRMAVLAIISTDDEDRSRDRVRTGGIETTFHQANPCVLLEHGEHHVSPVARAESDEGEYGVKLHENYATGRAYFSQTCPVAEQVFGLIHEGILRGASIGFRPLKATKRHLYDEDGFHDDKARGLDIDRCELLEFSFTAIPDQPRALVAATEILHKNRLNGRPLLDTIRKSLLPYATPLKRNQVVGGYSAPLTKSAPRKDDSHDYASGSLLALVALAGRLGGPDDDAVRRAMQLTVDGLEDGPDPDTLKGPTDPVFKSYAIWKAWQKVGAAGKSKGGQDQSKYRDDETGEVRVQISPPKTPSKRPKLKGKGEAKAEEKPEVKQDEAATGELKARETIRDAYNDLTLLKEFRDGLVEMPVLFRYVRRADPSITLEEFHAQLNALNQERKMEFHKLNEVADAQDPELAISRDDKLYYYVKWPKEGQGDLSSPSTSKPSEKPASDTPGKPASKPAPRGGSVTPEKASEDALAAIKAHLEKPEGITTGELQDVADSLLALKGDQLKDLARGLKALVSGSKPVLAKRIADAMLAKAKGDPEAGKKPARKAPAKKEKPEVKEEEKAEAKAEEAPASEGTPHPMDGMTPTEMIAELNRLGSSSTLTPAYVAAQPKGFDHTDPWGLGRVPVPEDVAREAAPIVVDAATRAVAGNSFGHVKVSDIIKDLGERFGLDKIQAQALLVQMHKRGEIDLRPFTQAKAIIPHDELPYAFPLDVDVKYYVRPGKNAPEPAASKPAAKAPAPEPEPAKAAPEPTPTPKKPAGPPAGAIEYHAEAHKALQELREAKAASYLPWTPGLNKDIARYEKTLADLEKQHPQLRADRPGFTGEDAQGRRWTDGRLDPAKKEPEKPREPARVEQSASLPSSGVVSSATLKPLGNQSGNVELLQFSHGGREYVLKPSQMGLGGAKREQALLDLARRAGLNTPHAQSVEKPKNLLDTPAGRQLDEFKMPDDAWQVMEKVPGRLLEPDDLKDPRVAGQIVADRLFAYVVGQYDRNEGNTLVDDSGRVHHIDFDSVPDNEKTEEIARRLVEDDGMDPATPIDKAALGKILSVAGDVAKLSDPQSPNRAAALQKLASMDRPTLRDFAELTAKRSAPPARTPEPARSSAPATPAHPQSPGGVLSALSRLKESKALNSIAIPDLYDALSPDGSMDVGEFHDALRHLADSGAVRLHPFTRPTGEMKRGELGMMADQEIKYYVDPTGKQLPPEASQAPPPRASTAAARKDAVNLLHGSNPPKTLADLHARLSRSHQMTVGQFHAIVRDLNKAGLARLERHRGAPHQMTDSHLSMVTDEGVMSGIEGTGSATPEDAPAPLGAKPADAAALRRKVKPVATMTPAKLKAEALRMYNQATQRDITREQMEDVAAQLPALSKADLAEVATSIGLSASRINSLSREKAAKLIGQAITGRKAAHERAQLT